MELHMSLAATAAPGTPLFCLVLIFDSRLERAALQSQIALSACVRWVRTTTRLKYVRETLRFAQCEVLLGAKMMQCQHFASRKASLSQGKVS